jgi:hypothetical protein
MKKVYIFIVQPFSPLTKAKLMHLDTSKIFRYILIISFSIYSNKSLKIHLQIFYIYCIFISVYFIWFVPAASMFLSEYSQYNNKRLYLYIPFNLLMCLWLNKGESFPGAHCTQSLRTVCNSFNISVIQEFCFLFYARSLILPHTRVYSDFLDNIIYVLYKMTSHSISNIPI